MTIAFQGIGVAAARSVAIGPAFITGHGLRTATQTTIGRDQIGAELDRLNQAVAAARRALKAVREQLSSHAGQEAQIAGFGAASGRPADAIT